MEESTICGLLVIPIVVIVYMLLKKLPDKIADEITVFIKCWMIGAVTMGLYTYETQGKYPRLLQTIAEWPDGYNMGFYAILLLPYVCYTVIRIFRCSRQ